MSVLWSCSTRFRVKTWYIWAHSIFSCLPASSTSTERKKRPLASWPNQSIYAKTMHRRRFTCIDCWSLTWTQIILSFDTTENWCYNSSSVLLTLSQSSTWLSSTYSTSVSETSTKDWILSSTSWKRQPNSNHFLWNNRKIKWNQFWRKDRNDFNIFAWNLSLFLSVNFWQYF